MARVFVKNPALCACGAHDPSLSVAVSVAVPSIRKDCFTSAFQSLLKGGGGSCWVPCITSCSPHLVPTLRELRDAALMSIKLEAPPAAADGGCRSAFVCLWCCSCNCSSVPSHDTDVPVLHSVRSGAEVKDGQANRACQPLSQCLRQHVAGRADQRF